MSSSKRKRQLVMQGNEAKVEPCHIARLPVEILAEVLSYTRPHDILALARTNKYYCNTLAVNAASTFIWKRARANFTPSPIPDPTPNFTESSYAAFLFDRQPCEICKKLCKVGLASYSLRLHLCGPSCRSTWCETQGTRVVMTAASHELEYDTLLVGELIPQVEVGSSLPITVSFVNRYYRKTSWLEALDARNKALALGQTLLQYMVDQDGTRRKVKQIMELSDKLAKWSREYYEQLTKAKTKNAERASNIANEFCWQTPELYQCPSFYHLIRSRTSSVELFTRSDFNQIALQMGVERSAITARKKRREMEENIIAQRKAVEDLHSRMGKNDILPSINTFRRLPVVTRMQGWSTSPQVAEEIRHSVVITQLAKGDVARWQEEARAGLRKVLGQEAQTASNVPALDPVDRLTARFRCSRCDTLKTSWPGGGGMSFAEACRHECDPRSKKGGAKNTWRAERFTPDYKAIDVIQQVLLWCGYTADDAISLEAPDEVGTRIQCLSCPSQIVMTYENLLRHCHRHERMELKLVSLKEASEILQYPIEQGLRAQLIERTAGPQRQQRIYACRHCQRTQYSPLEIASTSTAPSTSEDRAIHAEKAADTAKGPQDGPRGSLAGAGGPTEKRRRKLQLFQFDGLRSHAIEKHGISWVEDEDFFRQLNVEGVPPIPDVQT